MSKFGIIFAAHQTEDLVPASLRPWITARKERLLGHDYLICAVSMPFVGFGREPDDLTKTMLESSRFVGEIDHVFLGNDPVKETEARGMALGWLVHHDVTHLWQVDSDEFYTEDDIVRIIAFIEARPHLDWLRLSLKNQVFTPSQYLVEPFTPPRIHKVRCSKFDGIAEGFYQDNNVYYEQPWHGGNVFDSELPSAVVPRSVAWVAHRSWMNDHRSKLKCAYQKARWGDACTFTWDDSRGGLIFNPAIPRPEIARDGGEA